MIRSTRLIPVFVMTLAMLTLPACRDIADEPELLNKDLAAKGDHPLVPTPVPALDARVANGRADLVAYTPPGEEGMPEEEAAADHGAASDDMSEAEAANDGLDDVRAMLEQMKQAEEAQDAEAVAALFVPAQREVVGAKTANSARLKAAFKALNEATETPDPSVAMMVKMLQQQSELSVDDVSLERVEDNRVEVRPNTPMPLPFSIFAVYLEDEQGWFMELSDASVLTKLNNAIAEFADKVDSLAVGVKDGSIPADQIPLKLGQFSQAMTAKMMQP